MVPRERITFEQELKDKNPNGSSLKRYIVIPELSGIPAERRKMQASIGDGIKAKEEFIEMKFVLWLRYHPSMETAFRILYNGKYYQIIDIERNFYDGSCLITCFKINT